MIGVQFVTRTRLDTLLVVRFLTLHNLVQFSNIVPGRSINNLIDLDAFRQVYEDPGRSVPGQGTGARTPTCWST